MSFGFAISDFIAVGELAHRLYKDVYMVARAAPEDLRAVLSELSILSQSIDILIEETSNPDSTLVQAGESRVKMVNEMIAQAKETLLKMQTFANKHGLVRVEGRSTIKRAFDKLKYAKDASTINSLRSKLLYHNGVMNLLLTSIGNSSLERLQSNNQAMAQDVASIQQMMATMTIHKTPHTPVISAEIEQGLQMQISRIFMAKAESERPWLLFGIYAWMRTGKWWLLQSQVGRHNAASADKGIDCQAYTDLLKASWILIDVIAEHPQRTFLQAGCQLLELKSFASAIKQEFEYLRRSDSALPNLSDIEGCNTDIWVQGSTTTLDMRNEDDEFFSPGHTIDASFTDEDVLCRFNGKYGHLKETPSADCVVELLIRKQERAVYTVLRTMSGTKFCRVKDYTNAIVFQALFYGASRYTHVFSEGFFDRTAIYSVCLLWLATLPDRHFWDTESEYLVSPYNVYPGQEGQSNHFEAMLRHRKQIEPGQESTDIWNLSEEVALRFLQDSECPRTILPSKLSGLSPEQRLFIHDPLHPRPLLSIFQILVRHGMDSKKLLDNVLSGALITKNIQAIRSILDCVTTLGICITLEDLSRHVGLYRGLNRGLWHKCDFHSRIFWDKCLQETVLEFPQLWLSGYDRVFVDEIAVIEEYYGRNTLCPLCSHGTAADAESGGMSEPGSAAELSTAEVEEDASM